MPTFNLFLFLWCPEGDGCTFIGSCYSIRFKYSLSRISICSILMDLMGFAGRKSCIRFHFTAECHSVWLAGSWRNIDSHRVLGRKPEIMWGRKHFESKKVLILWSKLVLSQCNPWLVPHIMFYVKSLPHVAVICKQLMSFHKDSYVISTEKFLALNLMKTPQEMILD